MAPHRTLSKHSLVALVGVALAGTAAWWWQQPASAQGQPAAASATTAAKAAATRALEATIGAVKTTLRKGGTVSLVGFGTFAVGKRAARSGRNPRTGATIKIKAAKVPKFRPGKALKDALN